MGLVWKEYLTFLMKRDPRLLTSQIVIKSVCQIIARLAENVPQHEEDFEKTDPIVQEVLHFLLDNYKVFPATMLLALASYPRQYLGYVNIDICALLRNYIENMSDSEPDEIKIRMIQSFVEGELKDMPRSLYLGTSSAAPSRNKKGAKASNSEEEMLIEAKCQNWTVNPMFAVINLSRRVNKPEELVSVLNRMTQLPALSLQHWIIRIEFIRGLFKTLKSLFENIDGHAKFCKVLNDCEQAMREKMRQASSISVASYSLLFYAAIVAGASSSDANADRVLDFARSLLEYSGINDKYQSSEEIRTSIIFSIDMLKPLLANDRLDKLNELLEVFYSRLQIQENTWLWYSIKFGCREEWYQRMDPGTALSWNLSALDVGETTPEEVVKRATKGESLIFSGMTLMYFGASITNPSLLKNSINYILEDLTSAGPAQKKINLCYFVFGLLSNPHLEDRNLKLIKDTLSNLAPSVTDLRLSTWIMLLLTRSLTLSVRLETSSPVTLSQFNRFGSDSFFGICIDNLVTGPNSTSNLIQETLCRISSLPKMDWSWLKQDDECKVAWSHFSTKYNSQTYVNEWLTESVIEALEKRPFISKKHSERFFDLARAIASRPQFIDRLNALLSNPKNFDASLALEMLKMKQLSSSVLELLVQTEEPQVLETLCQVIGDVDPPNRPYYHAITKAYESNDFDQICNLLVNGSTLFRKRLMERLAQRKNILLDLITKALIAFEHDPNQVEPICDILKTVLLLKSNDSFLNSLESHEVHKLLALKLAWQSYCKQSPDSAEKISNRILKMTKQLPNDHVLNYFT